MKMFRIGGWAIVFIAIFLCLNSEIFAQEGASSASIARSRALSRGGNFLPSEVLVEEFVNYHKHRLPLPKVGQAVAMDTRWGNDQVSAQSPEAVLQIGFTTPEVTERTDLRPLNLVLVIDKSGSMAEADKMSRVKESLQTMIGNLRSTDLVSIVVFDTDANVLRSAKAIGSGSEIKEVINSIQPGGSTNLNAGLTLGYQEAKKNYRQGATNRVIMLTDGIANVGVTDPKKIAVASSEYNGQGIDLSTIGVGIDLDKELLRTLAKTGRGLYHFVSDAHDINKVFAAELQSLISPIARRVELNVDYDSNLELAKTFGYEPKARANGTTIILDDMNSGLTQVVMMKFRLKNEAAKRQYPVKVRISYFDIEKQKMVEQIQEAVLNLGRNENLLRDSEVKKNFTIAELAQSLYEMSEAAKKQKFTEAESFLNASAATTHERFPNMEDKDIKFVLDIIENYQRELKNYNAQRKVEESGMIK